MYLIVFAVFIAILLVNVLTLADSIADEVIVAVEHSVDGENFSYRNSIKLQPKIGGKATVVDMDRNGILDDTVADFKALLASNGLYKIRVRASLTNSTSNYVLSSLPAVCTIFLHMNASLICQLV